MLHGLFVRSCALPQGLPARRCADVGGLADEAVAAGRVVGRGFNMAVLCPRDSCALVLAVDADTFEAV